AHIDDLPDQEALRIRRADAALELDGGGEYLLADADRGRGIDVEHDQRPAQLTDHPALGRAAQQLADDGRGRVAGQDDVREIRADIGDAPNERAGGRAEPLNTRH